MLQMIGNIPSERCEVEKMINAGEDFFAEISVVEISIRVRRRENVSTELSQMPG